MKNFGLHKIGVFFLLINLFSCKPEEQELPPMTHEGRNTIGYYREDGTLIGGSLDSKDSLIEYPNGDVRVVQKYYKLIAMWQIEASYILSLDFRKDSIDNKLYFEQATYADYRYDLATLDPEKANFLSIDYQDASEKIISGTFELNFHNVDTIYNEADSSYFIHVNYEEKLSRGRFDFDYSK